MSEINKIQLKPSCILGVPFKAYEQDFTFIVNGEEFKTSRLIADLLSSQICRLHSNDPTFGTYVIDTEQRGDFNQILKLLDFSERSFETNDILFLLEVIEILGNDNIELHKLDHDVELTIDNVFSLIEKHSKYSKFYSNEISHEIEFISSHFYELAETHKEEVTNLPQDILMRVFFHDKLQLKDEDQLLRIANQIYTQNRKSIEIYEAVIFKNVSGGWCMSEFVSLIDYCEMTSRTWKSLSARLQEKIEKEEPRTISKRYHKMVFPKKENEEFSGIINYLRKKWPDQLENEIKITSSSSLHSPQNVILFDDQSKYFESRNSPNGWVCFDFCNHRVCPTKYTIRTSTNWDNPNPNPKSWVIEGSKDNKDNRSWIKLSEEKNETCLDGQGGKIHTFDIREKTQNEFQYIRIRQTGKNGHNNDYLIFDSFEIYGIYI